MQIEYLICGRERERCSSAVLMVAQIELDQWFSTGVPRHTRSRKLLSGVPTKFEKLVTSLISNVTSKKLLITVNYPIFNLNGFGCL